MIILLLITWLASSSFCDARKPVVQTNYGTFVGHRKQYYNAFEGIRYAQPPIEGLRFEPPRPVSRCSDAKKTFYLKDETIPSCIHFNPFTQKIEGSEDCLRLNVYTPKSKKILLPVIFHIHGGAWTFGSAALYAEKIIMECQEFIYVNFNYRMGVLGFLSSGDETLSGNMGLKDQAMALHWVRENIDAFGGDPEKIIITGFSSGAASVHLFYLSSLTRDDFAGGISHSGFALNSWVLAKNNSVKYNEILAAVGCNSEDDIVNLQCLKSTPAELLIQFSQQEKVLSEFPAVAYGLTVEPESGHAFLTESPRTMMERGDIANKPWIVSVVQDEGLWFGSRWWNYENLFANINNNWNELAPFIFLYEWIGSGDKKNVMSDRIKEFYINSEPIDLTKQKEMTDAMTDRYFKQGIGLTVKYHSAIAPTYMYHFRYKGDYGFGEWLSGGEKLGVCHGEDIQYIYSTGIRENVPFTQTESDMSNALLSMYKSFAKTGIPRLRDHEFPLSSFDNEENLHYLEIGSPINIQEQSVPYMDFGESTFWEETIPNDL